jgi:hypothetical protein
VKFRQIFTTVTEVASKVIFYPVISTYTGRYLDCEFLEGHSSTISAFTILAKMLGF